MKNYRNLFLSIAFGSILLTTGCSTGAPVAVQAPGFETKDEGGGTDRHNFVTQSARGPGEGGLYDSAASSGTTSGYETVKNTDIHALS
ncbi:MAG: hypothetical protein ACAI44_24425 [Candidatus Sericytochromatia bacterium]